MTALALLLALAAAAAPKPASTEAEIWALVRKANIVAAYQVYLNRFPDGAHHEEALRRFRRLQGLPLVSAPPPPAPPPPPTAPDRCVAMLAGPAWDSEEARRFNAARGTNRLADFQDFVRDFPTGDCRQAAERTIGLRELRRQAVKTIPGLGPLQPRRLTRNFLTTEDYPAAALRVGETGRVAAEWEVAEDGVVEGCRIARPSGSASLDGSTCRIVTRRLRYDPARDAAGRPVRSTDSMTIDWLLPAK